MIASPRRGGNHSLFLFLKRLVCLLTEIICDLHKLRIVFRFQNVDHAPEAIASDLPGHFLVLYLFLCICEKVTPQLINVVGRGRNGNVCRIDGGDNFSITGEV